MATRRGTFGFAKDDPEYLKQAVAPEVSGIVVRLNPECLS